MSDISPEKNILLIGFKSVGKSCVGKLLAKRLDKEFIDLDKIIENLYQKNNNRHLSTRKIVQQYGEDYFRELEHNALKEVLKKSGGIISLGGGTPIKTDNQALIKQHTVIHITATQQLVYQRLLAGGKPAFFADNGSMSEVFDALWCLRKEIYQNLATFTIDNSALLENTVKHIVKKLNESPGEQT